MITTGRKNVATRRKKGTNGAKTKKKRVPKIDLMKIENSKAIRQSSRPHERIRRQ